MGALTSSAFAVDCVDRTTNRSRAATSNEYVGQNNYCSICGNQKGIEDTFFEWSSAWLGMIKECGNGVFKCNPGSFKAKYYYDTYYCFPCPYPSSDITPSGSPSRPDYFSWKDGDEACVAYDTNVGEHCTGTREWRPVGTCWWSGSDSGDVNSVPYLNGTASAYSFQSSGNSCAQQYSISLSSAEAGYYASGNQCTPCPAGKYKDQVGTSYSLCKQCPYGVYNGTSLVPGQSAAGTTSSSGCYIMGENIPTQTDTSGTFVSGGGICNWTGGAEPKFGICINNYVDDETKCMSALSNACYNVLNAGPGSSACAQDIWNRAHLTNPNLVCHMSSNADLATNLQYINATADQIINFQSAIQGEDKCGPYVTFVVFQ